MWNFFEFKCVLDGDYELLREDWADELLQQQQPQAPQQEPIQTNPPGKPKKVPARKRLALKNTPAPSVDPQQNLSGSRQQSRTLSTAGGNKEQKTSSRLADYVSQGNEIMNNWPAMRHKVSTMLAALGKPVDENQPFALSTKDNSGARVDKFGNQMPEIVFSPEEGGLQGIKDVFSAAYASLSTEPPEEWPVAKSIDQTLPSTPAGIRAGQFLQVLQRPEIVGKTHSLQSFAQTLSSLVPRGGDPQTDIRAAQWLANKIMNDYVMMGDVDGDPEDPTSYKIQIYGMPGKDKELDAPKAKISRQVPKPENLGGEYGANIDTVADIRQGRKQRTLHPEHVQWMEFYELMETYLPGTR